MQAELEAVLQTVSRLEVGPRSTVAGRTDAGVHARGQVVHVDLPPGAAGDRLLLRRLNGMLPRDVRIHTAGPAASGFDARYSALSRTYRYRVADRPELVDPLRRSDTLACSRPLDVAAMIEATAGLLGLHDFAAYCKRRPGATTVRELQQLDWQRSGDGVLIATVRADAFCRSMVRSLVGALLAVGTGRRPVDWPASLLVLDARAPHLDVAPAHGLVLERVDYPPDTELLVRQLVTRATRARETG